MSSEKSRTYNAISNSLFGIGAAIISVILNFAVRIVIVRALGEEINGLHNLFQNTINVLALMETGISTAMVIHLYEPVKSCNKIMICQLLNFYKRIYMGIATIFLALGVFVDIFVIDDIVTTTIPMWTVRVYFLLFALSFFFNYLTYYKRSLLFAEQKNRISICATIGSEVVFRGLAIVAAIVCQQYIIFLLLLIVERVFSNYLCIRYVNKYHPYLKSKVEPLSTNRKKAVFNTIKPLFVNQTANTVQKSSNSILISMLLGNVAIVGYYGSYQLVSSTVELLFSQLGGAFTSGFGNLATENDKQRMYAAYKKSSQIIYMFAFVCCAGFIACIQDFIGWVFGANFVLGFTSVLIIVGSMFIYLLNIPIISVQNAMGLHNKDAKFMIVQAVMAIVLGYIGGKYYGMNGILTGLILPNIIFSLGNKGIVISKIAFDKKWHQYLQFIMLETLKCVFICFVTVMICKFINCGSAWINVIIKGFAALLVSIGLIATLSYREDNFRAFVSTLKKRITK